MSTGTQVQVVMPQMGVSVSEGTVTKWLKQEGEQIEQDEPLLEISTDKVDTEVPSPGAGTVVQILVPEGETVDVGTVLALIGAAGSQVVEPQEAPVQEPPPALAEPAEEAPAPVAPVTPEPAAASAPTFPRGAGRYPLGQREELRLAGRCTDRRRARGRRVRRPRNRDWGPRHEEGHPRFHRVGSAGGARTGPHPDSRARSRAGACTRAGTGSRTRTGCRVSASACFGSGCAGSRTACARSLLLPRPLLQGLPPRRLRANSSSR